MPEPEAAGKSRLPGKWRRRRIVSLSRSLSLSLSVMAVNVNVVAGSALFAVLSLSLSLFVVACSTIKSRAAIEGISLPVCRFGRSAPLLSLSLSLALLLSLRPLRLPTPCSLALNTLARQCDAFVMKRISGIRCLCVGNLLQRGSRHTWLCRPGVAEVLHPQALGLCVQLVQSFMTIAKRGQRERKKRNENVDWPCHAAKVAI